MKILKRKYWAKVMLILLIKFGFRGYKGLSKSHEPINISISLSEHTFQHIPAKNPPLNTELPVKFQNPSPIFSLKNEPTFSQPSIIPSLELFWCYTTIYQSPTLPDNYSNSATFSFAITRQQILVAPCIIQQICWKMYSRVRMRDRSHLPDNLLKCILLRKHVK